MSWGERGPGRWITVHANAGHTFVVIAGLRFDTGYRDATQQDTGTGPRWGAPRATKGYRVRHPAEALRPIARRFAAQTDVRAPKARATARSAL